MRFACLYCCGEEREGERHVSARLRGEETEENSVTTAPNALKSLTLLPLCVIWLTICLVIFALSFWLVVVYLRRTVPERRLVVREKKVVSLGPESPSQKERHHSRGGPGTPSLPLSLSLHERSGPGHLAPGQDGVSSHSPPRQADLALPVHQQDELNHLRSSSVSPQLPPPTSTTTRALSLPTSRTLNQRPPGLGNTFPEKSGNKNLSEKSSEKRDRVPDGGGRGGGNRGLRSPPGARRGFDRIISWTWRASRFTFRCPAASAPRRVARGWAQLGHTPLFHWPRGGVLSEIGPRHGTAG